MSCRVGKYVYKLVSNLKLTSHFYAAVRASKKRDAQIGSRSRIHPSTRDIPGTTPIDTQDANIWSKEWYRYLQTPCELLKKPDCVLLHVVLTTGFLWKVVFRVSQTKTSLLKKLAFSDFLFDCRPLDNNYATVSWISLQSVPMMNGRLNLTCAFFDFQVSPKVQARNASKNMTAAGTDGR